MSTELRRLVRDERPEEVSVGEIVAVYENNESIFDVRVHGGLTITLVNRSGRSFVLKDRVAISFPLGIKATGYITGLSAMDKAPMTGSIVLGAAEG